MWLVFYDVKALMGMMGIGEFFMKPNFQDMLPSVFFCKYLRIPAGNGPWGFMGGKMAAD